MSEQQWIAVAVLAGVVSAMSAYAFDGRPGLYVFVAFTTAMAGWVAFRRPDGGRELLGLAVFLAVMAIGLPLMQLFLEGDVGDRWGFVAMLGAVPAAGFYFVVDRWIRK